MKKAVALTPEELDEISTHDDLCYKFDLSRISSEKYQSMMLSLKSICLNHLTGLGFNLDLLQQTQQQALRTEKMGTRGDKLAQKRIQPPAALKSSVIKYNNNVTKEISTLLAQALPKTESLNFLKFRSIPLRPPDIELLAGGIYACDTLRVLRFCDVPLGDSGFARLARAMRKQAIVDLQLRHCNLTDDCGQDMHTLLSYHVFVQSDGAWKASLTGANRREVVCLKALDLRDNEFTFKFVEDITDPVLDLPLSYIDFRGNAGVSSSVVQSLLKRLKKQRRTTEVRTGPSKIIKAAKPKIKPVKGSPANASVRRATSRLSTATAKVPRVQQLEEENEMLRDLIAQLRSRENIVELEPGLKIVGPRAAELVEHIRKLDDMLTSYSSGPPNFLSSIASSFASSGSKRQ